MNPFLQELFERSSFKRIGSFIRDQVAAGIWDLSQERCFST
jgi:hypothetical protein